LGLTRPADVDQDGVVVAQVQRTGDAGFGDVQGAGGVQEVPPDGVGGGVFVCRTAADEMNRW
jgi:hypothetical protein